MTVDEVIADITSAPRRRPRATVKLATRVHHNTLDAVKPVKPRGMATAETMLKRCRVVERRKLMLSLLAQTGVYGAPAFEYAAGLLRMHLDAGAVPVPPSGRLAPHELRFVEERVRELVAPFVHFADPRVAGADGTP